MLKSSIKCGLLLAFLCLAHPAMAATFVVSDLSGQQNCLPLAWWQAFQQAAPSIPQCASYPAGTVEVSITPAPGELPVDCYGDGNGGNFCMYSADFYIAALYQGAWYAHQGGSWVPVDISQLAPTTAWPPWSGTASMGYDIYASHINLDSGKFDPAPEGFEVYVAIAPAGSRTFAPGMFAKVYPVPGP